VLAVRLLGAVRDDEGSSESVCCVRGLSARGRLSFVAISISRYNINECGLVVDVALSVASELKRGVSRVVARVNY
jgi:hypothetical protein